MKPGQGKRRNGCKFYLAHKNVEQICLSEKKQFSSVVSPLFWFGLSETFVPMFCLVYVGKVKEDHLALLILKVNSIQFQKPHALTCRTEPHVRNDK